MVALVSGGKNLFQKGGRTVVTAAMGEMSFFKSIHISTHCLIFITNSTFGHSGDATAREANVPVPAGRI